MMTTGQKIQEIRQARGYSQEAVALDLGISRAAYSKIERDETDVTVKRLEEIAKILQVNIWAFLSPESAITIMGDNSGVGSGIQHNHNDFTEERKSYQKHIENLEKQILQQQRMLEAFVKKMG